MKSMSRHRWHLDPPVPTATILLAHVQNAVPAFDHEARIANNSVACLIVRPAAVAGPVIRPGPVPVPAVPADRTPRAAVVVSPHGIPRKTQTSPGAVIVVGGAHVEPGGCLSLLGPAEGKHRCTREGRGRNCQSL